MTTTQTSATPLLDASEPHHESSVLSGEARPIRRGAWAADARYQAVAVACSVMPWASSQRSASIAALQPSAAAVMAWR